MIFDLKELGVLIGGLFCGAAFMSVALLVLKTFL